MSHARVVAGLILTSALLFCWSCTGYLRTQQIKSSSLDFLYPAGAEAAPAEDVKLQLPLRVGLAFAPSKGYRGDRFTELQKQSLLEKVAEAFRSRNGIGSVDVIPTSYLTKGGSFENLDRLVAAFGIDVIALVSYDQFQFSETGRSSWAYWTIVGAYVVKGEKNETQTMMDAVIYDIPSRAMLFHASGASSVTGRSLPTEVGKALLDNSAQGFELSTTDLIVNLTEALMRFEEQAASGTVRGAGTPAVAMVDADGSPVQSGSGGALGVFEFLLVALLVTGLAIGRTSLWKA